MPPKSREEKNEYLREWRRRKRREDPEWVQRTREYARKLWAIPKNREKDLESKRRWRTKPENRLKMAETTKKWP